MFTSSLRMQGTADQLRGVMPLRARRRLTTLRFAVRRCTSPGRVLPDLLIIGAMRGGTSSLYKWLGYHPAVSPALRKETEYFTLHYHRGVGWYRSHFPLRVRQRAARLHRATRLSFEATPYYLFHPLAAPRAARTVPDAKIVVLLRDPVERAYSHHQHLTRLGIERLPFEEAIAAEPERLAGEEDRLAEDGSYTSRSHRRYAYLRRGFYDEQLARWFRHYARDRFLILASEELYAEPAGTYQRILEFLGLSATPIDFRNYSRHGAPGLRRAPIPEPIRARLDALYAPHNERLRHLLGRSLVWMSDTSAPAGAVARAEDT